MNRRSDGESETPAEEVCLRDVEEGDLPVFYKQQRDPAANTMAAFPPRERDAFVAHWMKILGDEACVRKTILAGDRVAGYVVCFEQSGRRLVGYWLGRDVWGRGIATRALGQFLAEVTFRPLHAYVAAHNAGSIRVLEKCGFRVESRARAPSPIGGDEVDEFVYVLKREG